MSVSQSKEYKRLWARNYRNNNKDHLNSYRRERNKIRRKFFFSLWDGVCFLCERTINVDDERGYCIHHLDYAKDAELFGKPVLPFQNPDYVAVNKDHFVLLHRECHNAFHRVIECKLQTKKIEELKQKMGVPSGA